MAQEESKVQETEHLMQLHLRALERTQKENDFLREEVAVLSRHKPGLMMTHEKIDFEQSKLAFYQRKCEVEKRRLDALSDQVKIMSAKYQKQVIEMGDKQANPVKKQQKIVKALEDRLTLGINKFNEALVVNKELRETIENLRRERDNFQVISDRVNLQLQKNKEDVARATEVTNIAYEGRDQTLAKIKQIKQLAAAERQQGKEEIARLDAQLAANNTQKRVVTINGSMSAEEEKKAKDRLMKESIKLHAERTIFEKNADTVQIFQHAFDRLKAATGITDVDELVRSFIDAEDENYSLLQYMNELTGDAGRIEEALGELRREIEEYSGTGKYGETQTRSGLIRSLELKVSQAEALSDSLEMKYVSGVKTIQESTKLIERIIQNTGALVDGLDSNMQHGVTENNMMIFLGAVEQRTNELLRKYAEKEAATRLAAATKTPKASRMPLQRWGSSVGQSDLANSTPERGQTGVSLTGTGSALPGQKRVEIEGEAKTISSILLPGPSTPSGKKNIAIRPPVIGDNDTESSEDEAEDIERPLSRGEIRLKALKSMSKKSVESMKVERESTTTSGKPSSSKKKTR